MNSPIPNAALTDNINRSQVVLDSLLTRQSHWPLAEPGPSDAELAQIFDAALRAPDHARLRPWRFVLVRGEARGALGDVLVDLACARTPDEPRSAHAHRRQKAFAAPMVIALGAAVDDTSHVPEIEQLMSVGAATMNLLNAIHALGYGGFWATGDDAYEPAMHAALGFGPAERLLGFLFVGTPQRFSGRGAARPERAGFVREWTAPASTGAS
ncbi:MULTISPECIES: nitroreductase [unclassified Caballeronia]|uniref:nitroreductase family protein n=1 Tax=unclassified Caballeronia TaxID=2646786 RepID=UPI00285AB9B2|nr:MULTISPECIES: nitroreductase [unclassified Caballeronia]MDR5776832.1 nitroreductase [Caballeronia sp. LZ002]MDR5798691.1 nitroreductase [Caballeronia sp. LZ001]MDR5852272.1 nitroreductase [Caballeronia sp. LZ003]